MRPLMPGDTRLDLPHGRQLPGIPGLEVLTGTFRDHVFPRHSHEGLMIALIDDGAQRIEHAGARSIAAPGQIVSMPAGAVHAVAPATPQGWRYRVLTLPDQLLGRVSERPLPALMCETIIEDDDLVDALDAAHKALARDAPLLEIETSLLNLVACFLARHAHPRLPIIRLGREPEAVRRALEHLAAHLGRGVALAELAAEAGLDGFRLTRAFSRELGLPPHAWHLQHRLRHAQSRLARGEPVADVALAAGFADQSHFSRAFKRLKGVTPGRYRAAHGHPSPHR